MPKVEFIERWWRNFSVDSGFGVLIKDVRTIRMNGKVVTRGKGYEGLKLHGCAIPRRRSSRAPPARKPRSTGSGTRRQNLLHQHQHDDRDGLLYTTLKRRD